MWPLTLLQYFVSNTNSSILNFYTLNHLWPGLVLKLEDFWCWNNHAIETLLQLIINGDGSAKGRKLKFLKIEFSKLNLDWLLKKDLTGFESFFSTAKLLYDVHFEDSNYLDLLTNNNIRGNIVRQYNSKATIELWKFFSHTNFDHSRIILKQLGNCDIIQLNGETQDKSNKILSMLKLQKFEFYKNKIKMEK